MEDRETVRMRKYGESKTTRIMMATVPHVTSGLGLRKFQAGGFLLTREYFRLFMMTTNLFVIVNVKQLRIGGCFGVLLPFSEHLGVLVS